jgi:hypothetical protein
MNTPTLLEIIDILNEDDGAMIPHHASKNDIAECNAELTELELPALPPDYIEFLKINNGIAWNGIEFYGTDQVVDADNPDGYCLMDIITMSADFEDYYCNTIETKCLQIGRTDEELYTYNAEKNIYEIRDLSAITEIYDKYETFAELFVAEIGARLGLFANKEQPKQILKENYYDILQNAEGDILFCIAEREGEPHNPAIVYDGGEHALLYRAPDVIIILDYVHIDIRKHLIEKDKVLIAEMSKGENKGILREYVAEMKIVDQLPDEHGLRWSLPKGKTIEDISDRLAKKIETDDATAKNAFEFYHSIADAGNADAQYALGKLYLDERFYDLQKAVTWLQRAASQGHPAAIDELKDRADDDGKHDAYI